MTRKAVLNTVLIGLLALVAYYFAGHGCVRFYLSGRAQLLEIAEPINQRCNAESSCPTTLAGWQASAGTSVMLSTDDMLYFASALPAVMTKAGLEITRHSGRYTAFFCRIRGYLKNWRIWNST